MRARSRALASTMAFSETNSQRAWGFVFEDGVCGAQFGGGGGAGGARGPRSEPEGFFGTDGVVKGEGIGAEHDSLGIKRNPLLQNVLELRGINVITHQRGIGVNIF